MFFISKQALSYFIAGIVFGMLLMLYIVDDSKNKLATPTNAIAIHKNTQHRVNNKSEYFDGMPMVVYAENEGVHSETVIQTLSAEITNEFKHKITTDLDILTLANDNPIAAIRAAEQYQRLHLTPMILEIAGTLEDETVYRWLLQKIKSSSYSYLSSSYFSGLAQKSPEVALLKLDNIRDFQLKRQLTIEIMSQWANQDVDYVLQWLSSQPDTSYNQEIYKNTIVALLDRSLDDGLMLIETFAQGSLKNELISLAAEKLADRDIDQASAWLTQLSMTDPVNQRYELLNLYVKANQPEEAFNYLLTQDSDTMVDSLHNGFNTVATVSPQLVIEELERIPENFQDNVITTAFLTLIDAGNTKSMSYYFERLPADKQVTAVTVTVERIASQQLEQAIDYINFLEDEDERLTLLLNNIKPLLSHDSKGEIAQVITQSDDLSVYEKSVLLN